MNTAYPKTRTYSWQTVGWQPIERNSKRGFYWRKIVAAALNSATKGTPPEAAWYLMDKYLTRAQETETLREQGKVRFNELNGQYEMPPETFHELLVLAAEKSLWFRKPSGRKGFTAEVEGQPDMRRCSGCNKAKPKSEFRAEASEKRKATYNWGKDGKATADKRFYTHALCTNCRGNSKRKKPAPRKNYPFAKRMVALKERMTYLHGQSRAAMKRIEEDEALWVEDVCLQEAYRFHKLRIRAIDEAREKLTELYTFKREQPLPDSWQKLVAVELREKLEALFSKEVLGRRVRGKPPQCF